jgi:hypothetical protein
MAETPTITPSEAENDQFAEDLEELIRWLGWPAAPVDQNSDAPEKTNG